MFQVHEIAMTAPSIWNCMKDYCVLVADERIACVTRDVWEELQGCGISSSPLLIADLYAATVGPTLEYSGTQKRDRASTIKGFLREFRGALWQAVGSLRVRASF